MKTTALSKIFWLLLVPFVFSCAQSLRAVVMPTNSPPHWKNNIGKADMCKCIRLIFCLLLCFSCSFAESNQREQKRLTAFSSKELSRILTKGGLSKVDIEGVSRNHEGTKLFVECDYGKNGDRIVAVISADGSITTQHAPRTSILNDDGKVIGSFTNRTLVFTNGIKMEFPWNTRFGFSPGGQFFYIYQPSGEGASVFSSAEPTKSLITLDKDFFPYKIFEDNKTVFIFGSSVQNRSKATGKGLLLSQHQNGLQIGKEIDLSWAGQVQDMNPKANLLLIENGRDLFPGWLLYDINTKKRTSLGIAKEHGLFLAPSMHQLFNK